MFCAPQATTQDLRASLQHGALLYAPHRSVHGSTFLLSVMVIPILIGGAFTALALFDDPQFQLPTVLSNGIPLVHYAIYALSPYNHTTAARRHSKNAPQCQQRLAFKTAHICMPLSTMCTAGGTARLVTQRSCSDRWQLVEGETDTPAGS